MKGGCLSAPDVFISYSREDRSAARRFAERLADEGFSVWWDAALRSGETFDEVIETALKAAKSVVVLWSPHSVASRWVRAEATLADRKKKLVPVVIEPCDRPIIFELTHTADLSHWDGSADDEVWRTVIEDVRRVIEQDRESAVDARRPDSAAVRARPARSPLVEERRRPASAGHAVRKLDNVIFAPVGATAALNRAGEQDWEAEDDDDDRTRIFTRSSAYAEEVHCLELSIGDQFEKRFVVSAGGVKIGRSAPADIILPDSRVSRAHCVVRLADDQLEVSDLNSTNGTFINGERIAGSAVLPVGSVLMVGSVSFKHELRTRAEV
jgi:hypothetical protein